MMDPSIRPAWERWLAIALVIAVVLGTWLAMLVYDAAAR
jgi:hypothetical protein